MSNLGNEYNFEEMRGIAKKIDGRIQNLEKKLSNVNSLGLSLAPEELKTSALDVLSKYGEEIQAMRDDVEHCLEQNQKVLNSCIEDNENVSKYIEQIRNDLDKWEESMISKNDGTYHRFQEPISKDLENQVEDESRTYNNETLESNCINGNSENGYHSIDNSYSEDNSFIISKSNPKVAATEISETPCKESEKTCKNSSSLLTPLVRKKCPNFDDILKTPVDPGISVESMRALGKSNIKTKLYKTHLDNHYLRQ